MNARIFVIVSLALWVAPLPAGAETLYKLIDKDGKVTYVDKPPKDYPGKVIPIDIDPNKNRATLIAPGAARAAQESLRTPPPDNADRVKQAQARLDAARQALANARDNPGESDVERRGRAGGGTRPVLSEEYEKKIAALEEAVRVAEEELRRAQAAR